jgi:RES domain-containing protein
LLEVLVHSNLSQPPKHHRVVRIEVPDKVRVETISSSTVPGWDDENMRASRDFGDRWIRESRSAVLRVPSVITQGREDNIVFNPAHQDFALIRSGEPELVRWDERLFQKSP